MSDQSSVDEMGVIDTHRVQQRVEAALKKAHAIGWSDDDLAELSGLKARRIKSYRLEGRCPTLPALLSLAIPLGPGILNPVLSLVGHAARPLEEADAIDPHQIVADGIKHFAVIATAAADGRIDHVERPLCREAADQIIATVLPLSSAGEAA